MIMDYMRILINSETLNIQVSKIIDKAIDIGITVFVFIVVSLLGYILGSIASIIVRKILMIERIQNTLVKYGAITSSMWASIVKFISLYMTVLVLTALLTVIELTILRELFYFIWNLFLFTVLVILGLLLGGVFYKFLRDALTTMGLEEGLKKYNIADSLGGIPISVLLANIVKWYVLITFISAGLQIVSTNKEFVLYKVMEGLMEYIPHAILGFLVIFAALIFANFVGNRIKYEKAIFSDVLALGVEVVIIFFGIVLALPKFGIENVSVMEDSFKIMTFGIALGIAIALGLGLKDAIASASKRYEETLEIQKPKKPS